MADQMTPRAEVVAAVAGVVTETLLLHPTRVAVEGVTGSGKTTLVRELALAVEATGLRPAKTLSMDGWHHPAAHRRRQGPLSADGYYEDAYDLEAFRDEVLVPLGHDRPAGHHEHRRAIIDLATDEPVDPDPPGRIPFDGVLLVDGSFLGTPELAEHWDLRIWLDVPFEVALARGVARDAERLGGPEAATLAFEQRYHAAFRRYLAECDPVGAADVVIDNTDLQAPRLLRPR